jgi:hypothetical protein
MNATSSNTTALWTASMGFDAPYKWTMAVDKNRRDGIGIFPLEGLFDHEIQFPFRIRLRSHFCHLSGTGNLPIEIIAMGCAERHDAATCLRKDCCPTAVCVYDAADVWKTLYRARDVSACRMRVLNFHLQSSPFLISTTTMSSAFIILIGNARGFNNHEPMLPVNARNIAPGESDKTMLREAIDLPGIPVLSIVPTSFMTSAHPQRLFR